MYPPLSEQEEKRQWSARATATYSAPRRLAEGEYEAGGERND